MFCLYGRMGKMQICKNPKINGPISVASKQDTIMLKFSDLANFKCPFGSINDFSIRAKLIPKLDRSLRKLTQNV